MLDLHYNVKVDPDNGSRMVMRKVQTVIEIFVVKIFFYLLGI